MLGLYALFGVGFCVVAILLTIIAAASSLHRTAIAPLIMQLVFGNLQQHHKGQFFNKPIGRDHAFPAASLKDAKGTDKLRIG
eukprot:2266524-Amphidinium_carterae.1